MCKKWMSCLRSPTENANRWLILLIGVLLVFLQLSKFLLRILKLFYLLSIFSEFALNFKFYTPIHDMFLSYWLCYKQDMHTTTHEIFPILTDNFVAVINAVLV